MADLKVVSWHILRILRPCFRNSTQDLPQMRKHYVRNLLGRTSEDMHEVELNQASRTNVLSYRFATAHA